MLRLSFLMPVFSPYYFYNDGAAVLSSTFIGDFLLKIPYNCQRVITPIAASHTLHRYTQDPNPHPNLPNI
jgi:hypothetical protein